MREREIFWQKNIDMNWIEGNFSQTKQCSIARWVYTYFDKKVAANGSWTDLDLFLHRKLNWSGLRNWKDMAQKQPIFAKENMDQKRLSLLSAYSTSNLTSFPEHLFGNSEITCQSFHSLEQIESDESSFRGIQPKIVWYYLLQGCFWNIHSDFQYQNEKRVANNHSWFEK